jgi:hypothetical protein
VISPSTASQLTVSKVSAYFEIVVNTKLKERANEAQRQKRLAEGKDIFPMTQAEKVGLFKTCNIRCVVYVLLRCVCVLQKMCKRHL